MNKNFTKILTVAAMALATGCVTAGTWVNGYYIDGPLCTVCDGLRVVQHAYGTTVCAHCDGTGIEPPEEEVTVVNNVIYDTWAPAPPPRHCHHPRPVTHHNPPRHGGGHGHEARPARPAGGGARPKQTARANPAPRPTARPAGGGNHGGNRGGGNRGGGNRGGAPRGGGGGRRR